jgi:hypothetical protein
MAFPHPALIRIASDQDLDIRLDYELLRSAVEHRMNGLLQSAAVAGSVSAEPALFRELERLDIATWSRHQILIFELGRIKALLAEAGLDFMVLKGVTSEARWYNRVGERPSFDIDLLLAPDAVRSLDDALELLQPDHVLLGSATALAHRGYLQSFTATFGKVVLDIHTDLFKLGSRTLSQDLIWDSPAWVRLQDGDTFKVPSPSVGLIHSLTHLNRDRFNRLLGFVDAARALDDPGLEWRQVENLVTAEGLGVVAKSALAVVEETLGRTSSWNSAASGWRRSVWNIAWRRKIRLLGMEGQVRFTRRALLLPFLLDGRFRDAMSYWWRRLIPPAALSEYLHSDQPGGRWSKLVMGRLASMRRRQKARKEARFQDTPAT